VEKLTKVPIYKDASLRPTFASPPFQIGSINLPFFMIFVAMQFMQ
jgi:hypothetical protein